MIGVWKERLKGLLVGPSAPLGAEKGCHSTLEGVS